MSQMLLHIEVEHVDLAIRDLSAKIADLSDGSVTAERHFERIIGSDATPDLTTEERIARLKSVLAELEGVLAFTRADTDATEVDGTPDAPSIPPLSGHACEVLTDYAGKTEPPRLEGPHLIVGFGVPSAQLIRAASYARSAMAQVLHALYDPNLPEPDMTFDSFFVACEESYIEAGLEPPESLAICDAAICYLDLIVENPEIAWNEGLEIPVCLNDYVFQPILGALKPERLH